MKLLQARLLLPLIGLFVASRIFQECMGLSDFCNQVRTPSESYDVVIIGAGVSGLMAARTLYVNYSVFNITILEGRGRVGGRIDTIIEGQGILEVGASFIHDAKPGNPVFDLSEENNLHVGYEDIEAVDDDIYFQNGSLVDFQLIDQCDMMFYDLLDEVYTVQNFSAPYGTSLKRAFDKQVQKTDANYKLKKSYLDLKLRQIASWVGDEAENQNLGQDMDYEPMTAPSLPVGSGYYKIPELLLSGVPISVIQGYSKVVSIYWDINCSSIYDGSGIVYLEDGRLIAGRHIISTVPIGPMRRGDVAFYPSLRRSSVRRALFKASAISRLGVACANKVFIKWNSRWWPTTTESISVLWTVEDPTQDSITLNDTFYQNVLDRLWYRKIGSFNSIYNQPAMMELWLYGRWGGLAETLPIMELQSVTMQVLRKAAGQAYQIPEPVKIATSQWCSDEFAKGSFTFLDTNSNLQDIRTLAEPLPSDENPTLMFAGDATDPSQWSTVQGAWRSGEREAVRLARLYFPDALNVA